MSAPDDDTPEVEATRLSSVARAILTEFADSFPESAHFRGGRKLRKGAWERLFPEIERDVEAKEAFLDAVEQLSRIGVVSVKWRRYREGSEVDALLLERPERLYLLLGRVSPDAVREEMMNALHSPAWSIDESDSDGSSPGAARLAALRAYLLTALANRHPVASTDPGEIRDLATVLRLTPDEARSSPIRALSVRLFRDSKRLERLMYTADRISRKALGVTLSSELGLTRSYPEVSIAVFGELVLGGDWGQSGVRSWICHGEILTLPMPTVSSLSAVTLESCLASDDPPALLSVENKETFHTLAKRLRDGSLPPQFRGLIYGGGHPHGTLLSLMRLAKRSGARSYHFGDLDPDGLLIFKEIDDALGGVLEPYLMNVETYRAYSAFGGRAPGPRLELLSSTIPTLPEKLRALANEIVATGIAVEQEVVDVPSERQHHG